MTKERISAAFEAMGLGEMFREKEMGLFSKEEAPSTFSYGKTLERWEQEVEKQGWCHGRVMTRETLFVPSAFAAGYEAEARLLSKKLVAGLEEYISCAGAHNGTAHEHDISDVVDSVIRALGRWKKGARQKIADAIRP